MASLLETLFFLVFIAIVGAWIWRFWPRGKRRGPRPEPTAYGTAKFASWDDIDDLGLTAGKGYPLGVWYGSRPESAGAAYPTPEARPLSYSGDRHRLICAPTRAGKFVSCVGPLLLADVDSSALVVDVKGEAAAITGEWRGKAGPVHVLDPWDITKQKLASFNPLDLLKPDSPDLAEDAAMLADALVVSTVERDHHWNEEAKALLAAIMLHVACDAGEKKRTLPRVREIITLPPDDFAGVLAAMLKSEAAGGLVKRGAARFRQKADNEASGCLSTAQQQTHFLDSPRLHAALAQSTFDFADLKKKLCTIYLVLPAERLPSFNRWLRLLISIALTTLARTTGKPAEPIKFIVDEFPALGQLKAVETGIGLMAGFGVQFHVITQDFNQLKDTYGNRWESFVANSGILQTFGVRDIFTAEYVSKLLGDSTVYVMGESESEITREQARMGFTGTAQNINEARRPLLTPGEVMTMPDSVQLIFPANGNPVICRKLRWFDQKPWSDRGKPPPSIFKPLPPLKASTVVHGGVDYSVGAAT